MTTIHIARNNAILGKYPEDEVRSGLQNGTFFPSDLAWKNGMPEWKPLARWAEFFAQEAPPPVAPSNSENKMTPPDDLLPPPKVLIEPDWERIPKLNVWSAFWRTVKDVLFAPGTTFAAMEKSAGIGKSYIFFLTAGVIFLIFSLLTNLIFYIPASDAIIAALQRTAAESNNLPLLEYLNENSVEETSILFTILTFIIVLPIFAITPFINAGILHLSLIIFGGAKQKYDATFRVFCYAQGSIYLLAWIPVVGCLLSIWNLILQIIGLAKVHGISYGRATVAVLAPIVFCCVCGCVLYMLFAILIAAGTANHL